MFNYFLHIQYSQKRLLYRRNGIAVVCGFAVDIQQTEETWKEHAWFLYGLHSKAKVTGCVFIDSNKNSIFLNNI